jgi:hypothetical protein
MRFGHPRGAAGSKKQAALFRRLAESFAGTSRHGGLFGFGRSFFAFEISLPAIAFLNLVVL